MNCQKCGARLNDDDGFCPDCGAKIVKKKDDKWVSTKSSKKNVFLTLILNILPGGGFFYLGLIGKGIKYLVVGFIVIFVMAGIFRNPAPGYFLVIATSAGASVRIVKLMEKGDAKIEDGVLYVKKKEQAKKSSGTRKLNWVLVLVMSIFFGSFGVDRFILGHIGLGILKLITFGGFGVWWLIDLILIASKYQFKGIEWE